MPRATAAEPDRDPAPATSRAAPAVGHAPVCDATAMRKALLVLAALAVTAAVVVGIVQSAGNGAAKAQQPLSRAEVSRAVAGVPPTLAALRARVNELVPGGPGALDRQLRALRGHPVVVNVWASWCHPCVFELPVIQRQAVKRAGKVAFLGVNSGDTRGEAGKLLRRIPLPYPSFEDQRQTVAGRYGAVGLPVTAFYDARGRRVLVHQGQFNDEQEMSDEIDRYALGRR